MDVVQTSLTRIGGSITIDSREGLGTRMRIRIPLTLAILPALVIEDRGERYAVAHAHVSELVRIPDGELSGRLEWTLGGPAFRLRNRLLPVVFLGQALHGTEGRECLAQRLLVLHADNREFALGVDAVHDTEEIVVKPLHPRLRRLDVFAGATVRGDGRVALILDVAALARQANAPVTAATPAPPVRVMHTLLLVSTQLGARAAIALADVARIEEFPAAAFECLDDRPAVRWRNEVLPVAPLAALTQPGAQLCIQAGRDYAVIVHERDGQRFGFLAESIDDVVSVEHSPRAGRVIVDDRVTDLLDLRRGTDMLFPREREAA